VSDGIAYFANLAGDLCAFDARTGALLWWQYLTPSMPAFTSAPATYKGSVFVSDGSRLWAFDAKTGQMRWAKGDAYATYSGIAVAAGHIYMKDATGLLETYDTATGALKWTETGQPEEMIVPALANGVIYLGGARGNSSTLSAFDTQSDKLLWQDQATSGFGTPTVSNGMVYVAKDNVFNAYGLP
jgi:outer membrane protein assembly factor BamB